MSSITGIWYTTDETREFLEAFYYAASKVFQPKPGMTADQGFALGQVSSAFVSASRDSRKDSISEMNKTVSDLREAVAQIEAQPAMKEFVVDLRMMQKLIYRAGGASNRSSLGAYSTKMF